MALQTPKKEFKLGGQVLLAILLVLSIVLFALYAREGSAGPLHSVQGATSGALSPLKFVGASAGSAGGSLGASIEDVTASEDTLQSLREQNEELRNLVAQLEEYRLESDRLREQLDLRDSYMMDAVSARVIGRTGNAWSQIVTVDKGANDGVSAGLSVMGSNGLVGQVISTTASTSDVRLLTDPQSGVAVLVQSSREEGILKGSLEGLLYLEDVPTEARVEVGDVIVTSGLGGSHVKGLLVGVVTKIDQKQGDASKKIIIAPNGSADSLEEVLIVTNIDPETGLSVSMRLADSLSAQE